ncbi:sigma-70 family RNA polymerase sigma factor [Salinimicrobium tongyeongense]|uniref:Sigma-70 family RNA polymerase sigma factor n=1 Tax=Salinimicrobium tongyeongense TaxID=2809707 RepID=A0ABY6NNP4_9FLAO|nr:sigma-70 family RNA polymerase sigma factor [Salinimicrobium tongyeongense]UZH54414.1 sigma-70 family RNA polymerase sigma factor [Salinimicrobium tongyeongense]
MEIEPDLLQQQIEKAKKGKQTAFNYLLDRFWNDVYGFQLKRTQNEYDAEDITIQAFSRAFDKIDTFDPKYTFKTWIITISKNIHVDLVRKKNASIRARTTDEEDERVHRIPDETPSIEDTLITEQNLAQLLIDIKKLKPHYQEVIHLRYFQEKSYKEIAAQLQEPINNVKVKILRAKKLLAEVIEKRTS